MGLQQGTYALDHAPDWEQVKAALEASMGVRVRLGCVSATVASLRARRVGGNAHLSFEAGRLEWEAPLEVSAYFLAHLHDALVGVGARPLEPREPDHQSSGIPWRRVPLGRRLAQGIVGQVARGVVWMALLPLLLVAFVGANLFVLVRRVFRRLFARS